MIAAKAEGAHGEWLPWHTEFAWDRVIVTSGANLYQSHRW